MSSFWSWFVIVFTVANILAAWWLIRWTAKPRPDEVAEGATIDHVWDGDLQERNNPMPRWWLVLFYLSIVFSVIYLVLFPGLGKFGGALGWSSIERYEAEVQAAEARYSEVFARFAGVAIPELAGDPEVLAIGRNLFVNYCAACHGSDGRGAVGFPNLADGDWLYGNAPETIVASITNGRAGVMPPLGAALGEQGTEEVIAYVRSLSGLDAPADAAAAGKARFAVCAACHGADGKGNQALGAPNLTDDIWLYGSSEDVIREVIMNGRQNNMPAQAALLSEDQIHVLAAYVYSLSRESGSAGSP